MTKAVRLPQLILPKNKKQNYARLHYLLKDDLMKMEAITQETRLLCRNRIDTVLKNYPLYCPKCKQETLINVKELYVTVIKEPDAKTQSR